MTNTYLGYIEFIAEYLLYAMASVIVTYLVFRIGSTAYFNAKTEFIKRFKEDDNLEGTDWENGKKGDKTDEKE